MSNDAANTKPLRRSSGWFVFLVLSGILPFLARYGVFSQWILLLHILAGLLAVVPVTIVRWKHVHAANQETPLAGPGWEWSLAGGKGIVGSLCTLPDALLSSCGGRGLRRSGNLAHRNRVAEKPLPAGALRATGAASGSVDRRFCYWRRRPRHSASARNSGDWGFCSFECVFMT